MPWTPVSMTQLKELEKDRVINSKKKHYYFVDIVK